LKHAEIREREKLLHHSYPFSLFHLFLISVVPSFRDHHLISTMPNRTVAPRLTKKRNLSTEHILESYTIVPQSR
jgi:hypothetical protein